MSRSHNEDDDLLRQMRKLYAPNCSTQVFIKIDRSFLWIILM